MKPVLNRHLSLTKHSSTAMNAQHNPIKNTANKLNNVEGMGHKILVAYFKLLFQHFFKEKSLCIQPCHQCLFPTIEMVL
jgi:flagellar basal body rod protein FlgG